MSLGLQEGRGEAGVGAYVAIQFLQIWQLLCSKIYINAKKRSILNIAWGSEEICILTVYGRWTLDTVTAWTMDYNNCNWPRRASTSYSIQC